MEIIPIRDMGLRAPEAGRIRFGEKGRTSTGRERPAAIDTFRFTSPNRDAIAQLAAIYGGVPSAWNDPKASPPRQWQVKTTANVIRGFLMQGSLSQWYELWGGAGCERKCDGEVCRTYVGDDEVYQPCLCALNNTLLCKVATRLALVLPEVKPFAGAWRMETKGWNAAQELPMMINLVESLAQTGGLLEINLRLTMMKSRGGRRQWPKPAIELVSSPLELMAGGLVNPAIAIGGDAGGMPALPVPQDDEIDEIPEAELVEIKPLRERLEELRARHHIGPTPPVEELMVRAEAVTERDPAVRATPAELLTLIMEVVLKIDHDYDQLTPTELERIRLVLADLYTLKAVLHRNPDGSLVIRRA